jgi:serine/threonine-protein kinase HipA
MGRAIGLTVPQTQLVETRLGAVLLTRRFDREWIKTNKSDALTLICRHFLSGASLISPSPAAAKRALDGPRGKATYAYTRLADVIRRVSSNPIKDLQELYARMILNVAVHNTDDHLKNLGFLKDADSAGYRLAPLFDVVTQEGSSKHYLHMGALGREGSFENCLTEYHRFGLRTEAIAKAILQRVIAVVIDRHRFYAAASMPPADIVRVEAVIPALKLP